MSKKGLDMKKQEINKLLFSHDLQDVIGALEMGADVNMLHPWFRKTRLELACFAGEKMIAGTLIRNRFKNCANIDVKNEKGQTLLMQLIASKDLVHSDMAAFLLDFGASVYETDNAKQTPLMYACAYSGDQLIHKVLDKCTKKIINVKNTEGYTALLLACERNKYKYWGISKIVEKLLKKGANIKARNNDRQSVLDIACKSGDKDRVSVILANSNNAFNSEDYRSAYLYATGYPEIQELLLVSKFNNNNNMIPVGCGRGSR